MTLRFDQPAIFLLLLLLVPLILLSWHWLRTFDPLRRLLAIALRVVLIVLVLGMLAAPQAVREHDQLTVIGLVDVSGSMRRFAELPPIPDEPGATNVDSIRRWLRTAVGDREGGDRFGLIAFDGQAVATAAPTSGPYVDDNLDLPMLDGTNIAEAVRLGLAMMPGDTARRLILISDGNETTGDALDAARRAAGAGNIPIDIVPIDYSITRDVQVVRVEAPPTAQPNQTVSLRIVMQATQPTPGRLMLRREGRTVDLTPGEPGTSRHVHLPEGQSVHLARVTLGDTPVNRFEAIFEPDHPEDDALAENNRAEAFTATPSRGRVLIVSQDEDSERHPLARILRRAEIDVEVISAALLPDDLLSLQNYTLVVLDNVPSYDFSGEQHRLLADSVDRMGTGLIMLGGTRSFGAGGWTRTALAEILPLELDPPDELRAPSAALVLVIDKSGSMNRPVAGARATQQEVANEGAALAIESLRRETYIGVVAFDFSADIHIPLQRNDDPQRLAQEVRTIRAAGGTRIESALRTGWEMMRDLDVETKHMVLLTDGISHDPTMDEFVEQMSRTGVTITTIGVGDQIDQAQLRMIAEGTGSVFYHVRNPRTLPRVLVDSVQDFNQPLLKEGPFEPVVQPTGSTLTVGMENAPPLRGLVVTAPRADPTVSLDMTHPDGEPLLAVWQAGLGRVAAFTSDFGGRWSRDWMDWPEATAFWLQLIRSTARAAVSPETELVTTIRDNRLQMVLEAADPEEGLLDDLLVEGTVYGPDGRSQSIRLRQTGPGRYEADVPANEAGSYVVALSPRRGTRQLAPVIGGASRAVSEEFRRYEANVGLMEEIREITGGRRLEISLPEEAMLFDRSGMEPSSSVMPIWTTLLWWTLIVLLLDIANRRIAWNREMVASGFAAAIAKVTPWRTRAERTQRTLHALRGVSRRFDEQQASQSKGVEKLRGTGRVAPPPVRLMSKQKKERADGDQDDRSGRVSGALDALLGRDGGNRPDSEQSPSSEDGARVRDHRTPANPNDQSDGSPPGPGGMRESLLERKKRLRAEMERRKRED